MPRTSITHALTTALDSVGELTLFGLHAIKDSFRRPFEIKEIVNQMVEVGWRTGPLVMVSGFAFGVVIALQTRSEMIRFGARAFIPPTVSLGIFNDMGPLLTALLVAGRVGVGIGAELAGMRVTEQIDALEALAVDSFKYLVVTRVVACVLALPILTLLLDFSGLAGGMAADMFKLHMSLQWFLRDGFGAMSWPQYIPPTFETVVFGFIIGTLSSYLGYNAKEGAVGVGRASTQSVVFSSLLVIVAEVILVKGIQFWWPGS
jgi:phospholipid/cholesterol/gamma-HCH transport system permease protein